MISAISGESRSHRIAWTLSIGLLAAASLLFLFARGLSDPDEGRYSEIPRGMIERGDWSEMRLLGYLYYEKPPLSYWITAASLRLFGIRDWSARVPLLGVALALFGLGLHAGRKHWGAAGATAAGVMATTVCVFFGAKTLITDSFLLLWFSASCLALFASFEEGLDDRRRLRRLGVSAFLILLGVLTKGLLALVLPAGIVFVWLAWERRLGRLFRPASFVAVAFFLALFVPLVLLIERHNPGFIRNFFLEEHFARFLGRYDQGSGHLEPFWFYLPMLPLLLLPWFLFVGRAARVMAVKRVLATDSFSRFLVVWTGVVFVFFSASTGKLISYVFPAALPLALLIGRWGVAEPVAESGPDRKLWLAGLPGIFGVALTPIVLFVLGLFNMLHEDFAGLHALGKAFLIVPIACALPYLLRARRLLAVPGLFLAVAAVYFSTALLFSPWSGYSVIRNSTRIFREMAARREPGDEVVMAYMYRPSLPFYLNRPVWLFHVRNEMAYGMDLEPDRQGLITDETDLMSRVSASRGRWFVVLPPKHLPELENEIPTLLLREVARDENAVVIELMRAEEPPPAADPD